MQAEVSGQQAHMSELINTEKKLKEEVSYSPALLLP